ncbi:MAG: homoserine dehydrogenase [Myxococcota bacterium]
MAKKIRLGLFGLGVVGSGLVNIIRRRNGALADYAGIELEVVKAVVRDPTKKRAVDTAGIEISTDHDSILRDGSLDIIVELIGGIEPAGTIIKTALESGKPVVSANKALIAERGTELYALAEKAQKPFYAEASVGGGIPILKTLRESLVANEIKYLTAIINGTTNFILTKMEEDGLSYFEALKLASDLGFAEADPTLDVEGIDARHKLLILASHICGGAYPQGEITCEGITTLTSRDFAFAQKQGLTIKLLAIARRKTEEEIELRVHPTLIPKIHPLASVRNEFNAIYLHGDAVGEITLSGRGAGSLPTASAVYADIVDICTRKINLGETPKSNLKHLKVSPREKIESEYYIRVTVLDKPGVIGEIASTLGKYNISVSSVAAELIPNVEGIGEVDVVTHKASEKDILKALDEINKLEKTRGDARFIRIERERG